jgi:hypothetical protein
MALDKNHVELIERIIYKSADDIAVSFSRSFERLEERIDEAESRLHSRIRDVEERLIEVNNNILNWLQLNIGPDTKRVR